MTIALPASVLAGLAVTSHTVSALGSATFDTVALSTTTPNDFAIAASPASLSVVQGTSGATSVSTTLVSGSAESIGLSLSGAPAGVTGTFSPTPASRPAAASTLTLAVASTVATGTYSLTVTGTAASATHATGVSLTVTAPPPPLPSPWTDADIGAPAIAGSASYAGGVFTVNGAGADIFGTADQFNFASQGLTGNGTLTARVASQAVSNAWAKAGLMLRATSDPGSPYYGVFVTPANGVVVQWRTAQAGTSGQVKIAGTVPVYVRIVRSTEHLHRLHESRRGHLDGRAGCLDDDRPAGGRPGRARGHQPHRERPRQRHLRHRGALDDDAQRLRDRGQPGQRLGRPGNLGRHERQHDPRLGQRREHRAVPLRRPGGGDRHLQPGQRHDRRGPRR